MKLLEALTTTPGIPGREHRIRELILNETKGLFTETHIDAMGSLIGVKKPTKPSDNPLRIMLAAHMDQIGFMVRYIEDKGFLRVHPVGGFDMRNLFARVCTVCTDLRDPKGDLPGVMNPGVKPTHITTDEERKKIPEMTDITIDLGLPADEVKAKVKIGDMVVLSAPVVRMGNTVVSQCLDNRAACWIAIRAMQQLKDHACEIHCVFTVQEEVGLRGAGTSAYAIKPDVGIAIDTTLAVDTPGTPDDQCVTRQGHGAGLTAMDSSFISDVELFEEFEAVAKANGIKHQRSVMPRGGTDSGTIQRAAAGTRVFTLSCPTRYIHTVTEMTHLDDLYACRDLLSAYLTQAKR
jgi:endoglucanase